MSQSELLHLAADLSFIHTDHLWRRTGSWIGYQYYGPDFYEEVSRIAARGVMDMLFFGDAAETPEIYGGDHAAAVKLGVRWPKHDMMPMIPIMARGQPLALVLVGDEFPSELLDRDVVVLGLQ